MRKPLFLLAAAALLLAPAAEAQTRDSYDPSFRRGDSSPWFGRSSRAYSHELRARVWVDDNDDLFRLGDRLRLRFWTSDDAHVAVLHIDTDGRLEVLFPESPWDDDFVAGERSYSLPQRGARSSWVVRGRPGMGYFYILASHAPLDLHALQDRNDRWDFDRVGGFVRGDPFWMMERVTDLLLSRSRHAPYAVDYFSYHVGTRQRYPSYACYDRYADPGDWGWNPSYRHCSELDGLLASYPHYYDTRRFRGDRRRYLRELESAGPRHQYKEPAIGVRGGSPRPAPARLPRLIDEDRGDVPAAQRPEAAPPRAPAAEPGRARPTLERRRVEPAPARERVPQRPQAAPPAARPAAPSARPAPARPPAPSEKPKPTPAEDTPSERRPSG